MLAFCQLLDFNGVQGVCDPGQPWSSIAGIIEAQRLQLITQCAGTSAEDGAFLLEFVLQCPFPMELFSP